MFLFERVERLPEVPEVVPGLIHFSLILFFWEIGDIILHIDKTIFITTMVPILVGAFFYLYCVFAPMWNPQLPYRTPFSVYILNLIRNLRSLASLEVFQEHSAMKESRGRMLRDVRAIQWLVDRIIGGDEMQALVLAIPGSINGRWGEEVWKVVLRDQSTSLANLQARSHPGFSSAHEGSTVYELCRSVRYFFETYKDEGNFMDTGIGRTRHMGGYVETAASLVCCTGVGLG
jgi:hypothetical protein